MGNFDNPISAPQLGVSIKASYQWFITTCRTSHHCLYSLQVGSCLGVALRPFFWGTATQYIISSHLWKQLLKSLYQHFIGLLSFFALKSYLRNFSFFKFALKGYLPYKIELFQLSVGRNLGFLWVSLNFASVIGPENLYHPLKVKTIMIQSFTCFKQFACFH